MRTKSIKAPLCDCWWNSETGYLELCDKHRENQYMKLYYCCKCGIVAAFDLFNIRKHDLRRPEDTTCPVCKEDAAYILLEVMEK